MRFFEIGWFSKSDGPGNRIVIYLQGCNLRCPWCHSPHSWSTKKAPLLFNKSRCTLCGQCVYVCKQKVHKVEAGIHIVDRETCIGCGECALACPNSQPDYLGSALCLPTKEATPLELFEQIRPQIALVQNNGGITLSGGEALLQLKEVKEFLKICKKHGISTCIESSFSLSDENYEQVAELTDYWLAGLRDISFGEGNLRNDQAIIRKMKLVSGYAKEIIARYPVINGYTAAREQYERFVSLMRECKIGVIDLLKCNPDMMHYYRLTGQSCALTGEGAEPSDVQMNEARDYFLDKGMKVV